MSIPYLAVPQFFDSSSATGNFTFFLLPLSFSFKWASVLGGGLKKCASQPSLRPALGWVCNWLAPGNSAGEAPFLLLLGALLGWVGVGWGGVGSLDMIGWVGAEWDETLTLLSSISWPSGRLCCP